MTPLFINLSSQYKYPTHLAAQICKHLCKLFANWIIIEDFTDTTHSAVQRFNSVVGRKPATTLLFNFPFIIHWMILVYLPFSDYKDFKETKNVISGFCPIVRVLCAQCSKPNFESSNPPLARDATSTAPQMAGNLNPKSPHTSGIPQSGEDSGLDSGFCSEDGSVGCPRCECTYEVCRRCVQTLDSTISVPEAILQADEVSIEF